MNRSYWARIGLDMNRVDMKRSDMNSSARIGGDPKKDPLWEGINYKLRKIGNSLDFALDFFLYG